MTDTPNIRPRRSDRLALATTRGKALFLAEFGERGIVKHAAKAAGIDRSTAYRWYDEDAEFAAAWDDAQEQATDSMEQEAWRRGVEGFEKPVFQGGNEVGRVREYSDTLLVLMLKANRPKKYRDTSSIELTATATQMLEQLPTGDLMAEAQRIMGATPMHALPQGEEGDDARTPGEGS